MKSIPCDRRRNWHKHRAPEQVLLDDEMSGWEFYGNVVRNATTGVHRRWTAKRHTDNYFEANDKDVAFDNRGMNWQSKSCAENCSASLGTSCFHAILVDLTINTHRIR